MTLFLKNLVFTVLVPGVVAGVVPNLAIYAACVATCFHLVVLLYEEPHLARVFGPSYDQYCTRVRRWIPGWSTR